MLLNNIHLFLKKQINFLLSAFLFNIYLLVLYLYRFKYIVLICFLLILNTYINHPENTINLLKEYYHTFDKKSRPSSINYFFITSTIATYVFLYRERKDVNKTFMNISIQYQLFKLTLYFSLLFTVITFFDIPGHINSFLTVVNGLLFIINTIVSIHYTNVYKVTEIRLKFLTSLMDSYIRVQKNNQSIYCLLYMLCISLLFCLTLYLLPDSFLKTFLLVTLAFCLIFFFVRIAIDFKLMFLKSINNRIFSTNNSISYITYDLEDRLEVKLKDSIFLYTEKIKEILLGDNKNFDKIFNNYNPDNKEILDTLVSIYSNFMTTFKTIIENDKVDEELMIDITRNIYQFVPITNINGLKTPIKKENLLYLDKRYSKIYRDVLVDILLLNATNQEKKNPNLFSSYFVRINEDLREFTAVNNNAEMVKENALNIEIRILTKLLIENDIKNIVEFMSLVIEKNNLNDPHLKDKYLKHLFLLAIKSIELMHFKIAGYLIKILSSNFKANEINRVLRDISMMKLDKNNTPIILHSKIRQSNRVTKGFKLDGKDLFIINGASFEYCFYKLYLVLIIYNYQPLEFNIQIPRKQYNTLLDKIVFDSKELGIDNKVIDLYKLNFSEKFEEKNVIDI